MMERHRRQFRRVLRLNGQEREGISLETHISEIIVRLLQRDLSDADFDCDLPERGRADKHLIGGIENRSLGSGAELRIAEGVPEKGVTIQKKPHGMYSAKS